MIAILGGTGFVGNAVRQSLVDMGVDVIAYSSKEIDLLNEEAVAKYAKTHNDADGVVFVSANAPCRNSEMFVDNIRMVEHFIKYIDPNKHIVYVSSDAVYADSIDPLNEESLCLPTSYHGLMHITREFMISHHFKRYAIVRPTLIYGSGDPHNGYGPNQFKRLAEIGNDIVLFGKGEEIRDHVPVSVVGRIIASAITRQLTGVFNAVSGHGISFHDIADIVVSHVGGESSITYRERSGPMPHNGLRIFNTEKLRKTFPEIELPNFENGIKVY